LIGSPPEGAREVGEVIAGADNLVKALSKMKFTIIRWDEEFSTARALSDRKKYGGKSNSKKQWIDEAAAILILQDYLEKNGAL
jgi:RNase H-fold protein (predicted Holliday junction resolvase)